MDWLAQDTIAAIASAPQPGVRGIIRVAGPQVEVILRRLLPDGFTAFPSSGRRRPQVVSGALPWFEGRTIAVDILFWPTSASYTRQPTAEIHCLGSLPILHGILRTLCQVGARLAQPGEFTLRAFLGGRIDLPQAAAVIETIDADNEPEFRRALEQLSGGLSQPFQRLRSQLLDLLADLEAGLDFVDEDISFVNSSEIADRLQGAQAELQRLKSQISARGDVRHLPRVVLAGEPNAGKSSLFNFLVGHSAALVSDIQGTTRDFLTATLNHAGLHWELIDTAGFFSGDSDFPADRIFHDSVAAALKQLEQADVVLWCIDPAAPAAKELAMQRAELPREAARTIWLMTKVDQTDGGEWLPRNTLSNDGLAPKMLPVSVHRPECRGQILDKIVEKLGGVKHNRDFDFVSTNARCWESLLQAEEGLKMAWDACQSQAGDEFVATDLRVTLEALATIVGAVPTEELLDRLFSRFCIGK